MSVTQCNTHACACVVWHCDALVAALAHVARASCGYNLYLLIRMTHTGLYLLRYCLVNRHNLKESWCLFRTNLSILNRQKFTFKRCLSYFLVLNLLLWFPRFILFLHYVFCQNLLDKKMKTDSLSVIFSLGFLIFRGCDHSNP